MCYKNHCRTRMKGYKDGHWTLEIIDLGTFFSKNRYPKFLVA